MLSIGPPCPPWVSSSGQTAMISASTAMPARATFSISARRPRGRCSQAGRERGARGREARASDDGEDDRSGSPGPGIRARDILKRDITQKPPVQQQ
ncbi:hypothetical protein GCM10010388_32560 [Streptomyces mauvecolor]|uniref:hypothetical protein n=1 Tax=Streptomyces mauvecolor TaxID=58345 RepID=UPI0031DF2D4B